MILHVIKELEAKNVFCILTSAVILSEIIEIRPLQSQDILGTNAYAKFERNLLIHTQLKVLLNGNKEWTARYTTDGGMNGQHENIIPCLKCVAG